ncbi:uncharacterized protein LOC127879809 [Dreissena polymorpha]|uniref:TIR domain-containing protein n=1 Tax=Dreissena polymorpha TaxID=45954 RepID=A0A9D4RU79_DREPO|nr:uncharacterized protein LOC127879809 [Dreissena polymorpha]KAH3881294.1 hypothetical protein DPMN_005219 [Dreissena polymorpha]
MSQYICIVIMVLAFGGNCVDAQCEGDLQPWSPSGIQREDLLCCTVSNACKNDHPTVPGQTEYEKCCTCSSTTTWSGQEKALLIEYISVSGKSLMVDPDMFNDSNVYKIEHHEGVMTEIPSDICDWDKDTRLKVFSRHVNESMKYWHYIVQIDFSKNKVRKVESLNCLKKLDKLDLSHNKITHFKNTTINQLTHLRHLDLSYNHIVSMDPACISQPSQNLFVANFEHNRLAVLDITNAFSVNPFCHVDYTSNIIDKFVNALGFTLDKNKTYGPGFVSFNENNFERFPDFTSLLGLSSLAEFGQLSSFGFDFRDIELDCDCYLEPFLSMGQNLKDVLWREYFNITCANPPSLRNVKVPNLNPYDLVCNLTREDNCPQECTCIDRPNTDTLYVTCTNLKELPAFLPNSTLTRFISLTLPNNEIKVLSNKSYISKISFLDISNNHLEQIDDGVIAALENATLNLSNNVRLAQLPQRVQHRNLCITDMEGLQLTCGCQELWIENWLKVKRCDEEKLFKCAVPDHGLVDARKFSSSLLDCKPNSLIVIVSFMSAVLAALIICGTLTFLLRYEILIIFLKIRQKTPDKTETAKRFQHDVALTFNEEDDILRGWILKVLLPNLEDNNYRVFLPSRDIPFGSKRDNIIMKTFAKTRSFLVVLSEKYLHQTENQSGRLWTENEWKCAWNQFKDDRMKTLIIINYDHLAPSDVSITQISAFLRVGHTIEFGNHGDQIMHDIYDKLGPAPNQSERREIVKKIKYTETHRKFNGYPKIYPENSNIDMIKPFDVDILFRVEKKDLNRKYTGHAI